VSDLLAEIAREIQESIAVKEQLLGSMPHLIADATRLIIASLHGGGKLIVFGNGGSAGNAEHIAPN